MPPSSLGGETPSALSERIACLLARYPAIKLGILFGSLVKGRVTSESDLDLGVAASAPLDIALKTTLIEALAELSGRPVDLVDLQVVHGPILQQVLTQGKLIYCSDRMLYAALIRTMLFNQSDMMPYYDRILAERRKAWIGR
jgi:predicted nucleotidyltransferase